MDRFEQLAVYFLAVKEFHLNRETPICNVVSLMLTLPKLLDKTTSPAVRKHLGLVIQSNQHLLPKPARGVVTPA